METAAMEKKTSMDKKTRFFMPPGPSLLVLFLDLLFFLVLLSPEIILSPTVLIAVTTVAATCVCRLKLPLRLQRMVVQFLAALSTSTDLVI